MSDRESIEYDAMMDAMFEEIHMQEELKKIALENCIYLFVEGESEELAFRILLEEGLGIDFEKYGVVIANYNGIGNLKHTVRLMNKTLSHKRPMIFTFDDDEKNKVPKKCDAPQLSYFFKIPHDPIVILKNGEKGGSFEESFLPQDFIDACFETTLLKSNPQINKKDFEVIFQNDRPFYDQIVKFLQSKGLKKYTPSKIEIAESLAVSCVVEPPTYVELAKLIQEIRNQYPVYQKM